MNIKRFFDIIVPRFITEDTALRLDKSTNSLYPICCVLDLEPGEIPDAVCKIKLFNFFGLALFPKQDSLPMTWQEYLEHLASDARTHKLLVKVTQKMNGEDV